MRGLNRQYTKAILIKIRYYNRKKTFKSSSLPPSPPPQKKKKQQQHGVAPLPSFLMLKGPVILLFSLYYCK